MKDEKLLSVIVPIYNVAEYLQESLDSIARAVEGLDAEVLLLDDGSTDDSPIMAEAFAADHPAFIYQVSTHKGPGRMRNIGMGMARGKYISFVDSDDIVCENLFRDLIALADKNDSDVAICNYCRYTPDGTCTESRLSRYAFFGLMDNSVTLPDHPNLLYSNMVWARIYRTSFLLKKRIRFPEDSLYEDFTFTGAVLLSTSKVSFLPSVGYYWRIRSSSITQSTDDKDKLMDRLKMATQLFRMMKRKRVGQALISAVKKKLLLIDYPLYIDLLKDLPESQARAYMELLRNFYFKHIGNEALAGLPALVRQKIFLLLDDDLPGICRLLDFQEKGFRDLPAVSGPFGSRLILPPAFFRDEWSALRNEYVGLPPRVYISSASFNGEDLVLSAHLYYNKASVPDTSSQFVRAFLVNKFSNARTELRVTRVAATKLTQVRGRDYSPDAGTFMDYNYDGCGFRIQLGSEMLADQDAFIGPNLILLCFGNQVCTSATFLRNCDERLIKFLSALDIPVKENRLRISFDELNYAVFFLGQDAELSAPHGFSGDDSAAAAPQVSSGGDSGDPQVFSGEIPATLATTSGETAGAPVTLPGENAVYRADVSLDKDELRLSITAEEVPKKASRPAKLGVWNKYSRRWEELIPVVPAAKNKKAWSAAIPLSDVQLFRNFYSGNRRPYLLSGNNRPIAPLRCDTCLYQVLYDTLTLTVYRNADFELTFHAANTWGTGEETANKRGYILDKLYPTYMEEPVADRQILFIHDGGSCCGGDPELICKRIAADHPKYRCIWALSDQRMPVPGEAERIRIGSDAWYRALARSQYLVTDTALPDSYVSREGQTVLRSVEEASVLLPQMV